MKTKELELYIHIPFCVKKCNYCDFLSFSTEKEQIDQYCIRLIDEIKSWKHICKDYIVTSIFIGGGTPSLIDESWIERVLDAIRDAFCLSTEVECTIEANPGTVTKKKLETYQKSGINRISFGLQSTDDKELELLGRIHTYGTFLENFSIARELGFHNINIDLMSAIPTQSIKSYEETLNRVCKLNPEHISAYSLIIEEGTNFYDNDEVLSKLPSEDDDIKMYQLSNDILSEYGYHRYELSNYAKIGYECRHNEGYWKRTPYLGFGLGASSLFEEKRFSNQRSFSDYIKVTSDQKNYFDTETLLLKEQMEEFVFLGLRRMKGISKDRFFELYGRKIHDVYHQAIEKSKERGLLMEDDYRIKLTKDGYFLSNQVFVEFI